MAGATNSDQTNYLILTLNDTYDIEKVTIYAHFYTDWYTIGDYCANSLSNFYHCANEVNNTKVNVKLDGVLIKTCGEVVSSCGLKRSEQTHTVSCVKANGNQVEISRFGTRLLLPEVVVSTGRTETKSSC